MLEAIFPYRTARTIVMDPESHVLALRRACGARKRRGHFDLPGGRQEPFEQPIDTAVRETREESGLRLKRADMYFLARLGQRTFWVSLIEEVCPEISLSREHDLAIWSPLDEVSDYLTHPLQLEAIDLFKQVPCLREVAHNDRQIG